jgi:hypothetical protein
MKRKREWALLQPRLKASIIGSISARTYFVKKIPQGFK